MDKVDYTQKYFKMHCCFCNQKILVENKNPGELFNCPACKDAITTPDYLKEVVQSNRADSSKEQVENKVLKLSSVNVRQKRRVRSQSSVFSAVVTLALAIGALSFFGKNFLEVQEAQVKTVTKSKKKAAVKLKKEEREQADLVVAAKEMPVREELPLHKQPLDLIFESARASGSLINKQEVNLLVSLLKKHCYECHGNKKHEEELNFEEMLSREDFFKNYIHFKNSLDYISSKEMPPADNADLESQEIEEFTQLIEKLLYTVEASSDGKTGPVKLKRLNAKEYDNTVEAVTGVNLDLSRKFNINNLDDASVLSLEGFIEAAQKISLHSNFDVERGFTFSEHEPDFQVVTQGQEIDTLEVEKRNILSQFYFSSFSYTEAIRRSLKVLFYLKSKSAVPRKTVEDLAKKYGLSIHFITKAHRYFNSPGRTTQDRQALEKWHRVNTKDPKDLALATDHFIEFYEKSLAKMLDENSLKSEINIGFIERVQGMFKFSIDELQLLLAESPLRQYLASHSLQSVMKFGLKSSFLSQFQGSNFHHFEKFLSKLYRKPVSASEVAEFSLRFAELIQKYGLAAATRIIMNQSFISVEFLYIFEDKKTKDSRLSAYELACRISYFLWDTPPNATLLALAEDGSIFESEVLIPHIQSMLHDQRFKPFVDEFTEEWLHISSLKSAEDEPELKRDMYLETTTMLDYIFRNDEKLTRIISSDYTFLNSRLAEHYGIAGDFDRGFEKTVISDRDVRGSILSHASVLTATSSSEETNPVIRGNFILTNILGMATPPPPPDAGTLEEKNIKAKTKKEAFAMHRDAASCQGCHLKIDPLGFPLENYDSLGRLRENMDNVGELTNGKKITGMKGLRKYILNNKDAFLKNLAAKMFSKALGRGLYYYDYYIVNRCLESLKKNDYRFSSLVATIVLSHQFQNKF